MEYGELYLPPVAKTTPGHNAKTGCFMKGHVPFNKGKKWSEYLGKRAQKKIRKGWQNVMDHRPKSRPDTAERCRKAVIAVRDDGSWVFFPHAGAVEENWGCGRRNVCRCCNANATGMSKARKMPNTDHRYMGIRFYYDDDDVWMTKIKDSQF